MSKNNKNHDHSSETKSSAGDLKPIMVAYLANQIELEKLSKLIPNESSNFAFDQSISNLMVQQEKMLQNLCEFEIRNANDAKRILKVWASEDVNPNNVSIEQQLVFNVYNFLENNAA